MGNVKTTIEIPDALVREVKLRALHEGRKLKDVIADLLRRGLDAAPSADAPSGRHEPSGLPVIQCKHAATRQQSLTPDRVSAILLEQEVEWQRGADAGR